MSQGAADWYIRKPLILAVLGTSLSAGRLSGNLWWQRLMANARCLPEAVGPVVLQNFGKGSQTSVYGVDTAPLIADYNPTHVLSEGFAINDSAFGISRPDHLANMLTIRNILKAKNPEVDITWQTMNGVSTAGEPLRPFLPDYYQDEIDFAALHGDTMLDHYNGLPSPPAIAGGWPKPLPESLTDSNDGLHPIWDNSLELYFWPGLTYWLRVKMALHWGLAIPNPPEPPTPPDAQYTMAAGGGGGGAYVGAGAGAGGLRRATAYLEMLAGPVLVGFGGEGGTGSSATSRGFNGLDSVLGSLIATGGGAGAGYATGSGTGPGGDGGSGGGSYGPGVTGGSNVPGQGNPGGLGLSPNSMSGGGGGAGAAGGSGASGGLGGVGVLADWPGAPGGLYICGGGPGVAYPNNVQAYPNGGGPTNYGGGGRGGDEAANAAYTRGNGGDGIVNVWYAGAARATGGTITTFGGFTVHQFTRADLAPHVKLTSNASSGYTITTSTNYDANYAGWKAMNGRGARLPPSDPSNDNAWVTSNGAAFPHTFRVQLPAGKAFKGYRIQARDFVLAPSAIAAQCLKDWVLEGSNDAVAWTLCDTRAAEPAWVTRESRVYNMNGPGRGTAFLYYRLTITALQGNDFNRVGVAAFDLLPALDML